MPDNRRGRHAAAYRTGWQSCSSAKQPAAGRRCWAEATLEAGMLAAAHMARATRMPLAALSRILHSVSSHGRLSSWDFSLRSLLQSAHLSFQAQAGK